MATSVDTVVVGAGTNGLVAAIALARGGSKVIVVEPNDDLGGAFREVEFAPGFKAAPLAGDLGYLAPDVVRGIGLGALLESRSDPTVISIAGGEPLSLYRQVDRTAAGLKRFSAKDAEKWPAFAKRIHDLASFFGQVYRNAPPRIDANTIGEFLTLAGLGRKLRGMGKVAMVEVLRTVPMAVAELVDDWFESDRLKGTIASLGVGDICQGPISGGTAFTLLHRHVGAELGVLGERLQLRDGPQALISALADRAEAAGVAIQKGAVARVVVRDDRVAGVVLESGDEIGCREVVSTLDPYRSMLELVDPIHLDPEFIQAIRNVRFRGVTTKILVALDGLPAVPGVAPSELNGTLVVAPSVRYLEKAYDATKYGQSSSEPFLEVRFPSVAQARLAPAGKHVAVISVQYTPYALRGAQWDQQRDVVADRAIGLLDQSLPGFASRVTSRTVLTPRDLETRFGLREGAVSQGEMMLDQILFMRPVAGWARHAMPVAGLFLGGAGTHPGGGITGMPGWLAAQSVVARRKA